MELPKNITQIGESDSSCKIYVEDYVISYIKQMNRLAENKQIAVALYGIRKSEQEISYLFFYGACKLDFLTREVRHLSQAQNLETEKLRKRYFPDYEFLGYRLLNGEMVEGFHICEQGICRYIKGYACFYEKNDSMLAYMLDTREEDAKPEEVDQEKYEQVRQRQEARRQQHDEESRAGRSRRERQTGADAEGQAVRAETEAAEFSRSREENGQTETSQDGAGREGVSRGGTGPERTARESGGQVRARGQERRNAQDRADRSRGVPGKEQQASPGAPSRTLRMMRAGVVGMFALLCVVGITTMNGSGKLDRLQVAARQLFQELTEKKIPDAGDAVSAMNQTGQTNTLVAEDKLADAIAQENKGQEEDGQTPPGDGADQIPDQTAPGEQPAGQGDNGQNNAGQTEGTALPGTEQGTTTAPGTEQGTTAAPGTDPGNTAASGTEQENTATPGIGQENAASPGAEQGNAVSNGKDQSTAPENTGAATNGQAAANNSAQPSEEIQPQTPPPETQQVTAPVSYTIQSGDTLIGICTRMYGSDSRVQEICNLNSITNPDNIRIGQKILLPQ